MSIQNRVSSAPKLLLHFPETVLTKLPAILISYQDRNPDHVGEFRSQVPAAHAHVTGEESNIQIEYGE